MDDTLKNAALGFLAFLVVNGQLRKRAEHDAARQIREAFAAEASSQITARVDTGGLLGLETSRLSSVDIYGDRLASNRLPFLLYPRSGWNGRIRHLRLHLTNFTLSGLPVKRFDADVPNAAYDLGHALYRHRLHLRSADPGVGQVVVGPDGLETFVNRKFHDTLSDVKVCLFDHQLFFSGNVHLFSQTIPVEATGALTAREGRYVDLTDPTFLLNKTPLSRTLSAVLLQRLNPVLDTVADLDLGGVFSITGVEIGDGELIVAGRVTVPTAPVQTAPSVSNAPPKPPK